MTDESGNALLVPIVQATWSFDAAGSLTPAEQQLPVKVAGELYGPQVSPVINSSPSARS